MSLVLKAKGLLKVHSKEFVIDKLSKDKKNKKAEVIKAVEQAINLK